MVNVTMLPLTKKKIIKTSVSRFIGDGAVLAAGKDPWTYEPVSYDRDLTLGISINDLGIQTDFGEGGSIVQSTLVNIGPTPIPIYDLIITAAGGGAPSLSLTVYPEAISQGWNQSSLQADLTTALAATGNPGEYAFSSSYDFLFPTLTFHLPANEAGSLETFDQVAAVPEPSTMLLIGTGIALFAGTRKKMLA
jgi:hypothetical protein